MGLLWSGGVVSVLRGSASLKRLYKGRTQMRVRGLLYKDPRVEKISDAKVLRQGITWLVEELQDTAAGTQETRGRWQGVSRGWVCRAC